MGTYTKQQWQQVVSDKLSGDESITNEEIKEILDYLWDYLPPLLHSEVMKILEKDYLDYDIINSGNTGKWEKHMGTTAVSG